MALTQIAVPASSSGSSTAPQPDKQIGAISSSSNAVLYTVPEGRKFVGFASHERTHYSRGYHAILVTPDGTTEVMHTGGFATFSQQQYSQGSTTVELTLLAGVTIKNGGGSNNCVVWGIESDA